MTQLEVAPSRRRTTVAFYTLGCKVNQAETDAFRDDFMSAGYSCIPFDSKADVYIVNTCTVTHVGDAKSRQILRQARRLNPDALVVATGCYASIMHDRLPVDNVVVVRNRDKDRLLSVVNQHLADDSTGMLTLDKPVIQGLVATPPNRRGRPMVKVQDGCDNACAYCIIPRARGRSRSTEPGAVLQRVNRLAAEGHTEVVLTGVDIGSYGEDLPQPTNLGALIETVLGESSVHRLRISSVEPGDFNPRWLALWKDTRLCRHFHVPLQAGNNAVLTRMRRKYDRARYLDMITAIRAQVPGVAITTDIITGFPGETEEEFNDGLGFIDQCQFDGLHVFPYSGGPAPPPRRCRITSQNQPRRSARQSCAGWLMTRPRVMCCETSGRTVEVVWESCHDGVWRGVSR